jgi:hypothetical protein
MLSFRFEHFIEISFRYKPLMKIAQKLLISDKATFDQLTSPEQNLLTRFETEDIYRFLTDEPDAPARIPVQMDIHSKITTIGTNARHSVYSCTSPGSSFSSGTTGSSSTSTSQLQLQLQLYLPLVHHTHCPPRLHWDHDLNRANQPQLSKTHLIHQEHQHHAPHLW